MRPANTNDERRLQKNAVHFILKSSFLAGFTPAYPLRSPKNLIQFINTADVTAKIKKLQENCRNIALADKSREWIAYAAVRLTNKTVFAALYRCNALEKAHAAYQKVSESHYRRQFGKASYGFVTNKNRFVGLYEAYEIALKAGQMTASSYVHSVKSLWGVSPERGYLNDVAFNECRKF